MASLASTVTATALLTARPAASADSAAPSAGAAPLLPVRATTCRFRGVPPLSTAAPAISLGGSAELSAASARGRSALARASGGESKGATDTAEATAATEATSPANSDSESEDPSSPRLTVAEKLQLQITSPASLPDGTAIPLPLGGRRRVLSSSYPLAAWTPAQKRNLARATLLSQVGQRNDSVLFATIGALVLGPPLVILAVAFFTGYVDFLG